MLSMLTERLIQDEVKNNDNNLLIEGIMLASNISNIKRYSHLNNLSESCDEECLNNFKNKLLSVNFSNDMSVDNRKDALLNSVKCLNNDKQITNNESSIDSDSDKDEKLISLLKSLRHDYVNACNENDKEMKANIISKIKNIEKIIY